MRNRFLNKYKWVMVGLVAGAIGGYLYYQLVGCASGSCAITSNPWSSTLYGTLMGGLLFDLFRKKQPAGNS
ncbi:MAG: hypothetical protein IPG01_06340 [Chitinophagaceae bacterium]|nr:hypothetical protein [Chitinophagaceae bacterium]